MAPHLLSLDILLPKDKDQPPLNAPVTFTLGHPRSSVTTLSEGELSA